MLDSYTLSQRLAENAADPAATYMQMPLSEINSLSQLKALQAVDTAEQLRLVVTGQRCPDLTLTHQTKPANQHYGVMQQSFVNLDDWLNPAMHWTDTLAQQMQLACMVQAMHQYHAPDCRADHQAGYQNGYRGKATNVALEKLLIYPVILRACLPQWISLLSCVSTSAWQVNKAQASLQGSLTAPQQLQLQVLLTNAQASEHSASGQSSTLAWHAQLAFQTPLADHLSLTASTQSSRPSFSLNLQQQTQTLSLSQSMPYFELLTQIIQHLQLTTTADETSI